MSGTVDLRRPEEIARLRHFLRSALNNIVGYADVVRRQAEEQGVRSAAVIMGQAAAAGREGIEIVQHLLPVKSHVSESALPMLRSNLATRVERIVTAVASFEAKTRGACAAEVGKIRLALEDLAEFQSGAGRTRPAPATGLGPGVFEMPPAAQTEGPFQLPHPTACALVVDKDGAAREELVGLLEAAGLTAAAEASAGVALERLRRDPVDLVLLDAEAAGMIGEVRATPGLAKLPALLLAGPDQHEAALRVLETGADDFVPKPIYAAVLRVRINGLLRRR